ncbi:MAG: winged helix-turn-helix transcriptional regulator [Acidobacteriota bacterium]
MAAHAHGDIVKTEARRDLLALEAIAENERITQRRLATKLGIALGMTNLYLKRLVRKGFVKCVNVQANRIRYLVTPKGIAEKTRLTYEFMEYSLHLYGQTRLHLRQALKPLAGGQHRRVAIYGSGEAAELAYLSILELGLDFVGVFDGVARGTFLGQPVLNPHQCAEIPFDALVIATLDSPAEIVHGLVQRGIPRHKLVTIRHTPATDLGEAVGAAAAPRVAGPTSGGEP